MPAKDLYQYVSGERFLRKKERFLITMLNSTEDAAQYIDAVRKGWVVPRGKIHFVLVSTDRMKLSAQKFVFAGKWDSHRFVWRSPDTGLPLQAPPEKIEKERKESDADALAQWTDAVASPAVPPTREEINTARKENKLGKNGVPIGYITRWKDGFRSFQESYDPESKRDCSLARPAQKKWKEVKGNHRWMIAQMMQRMLPNHFHLGIFDEIQHMKATDSGRGAAFHKLLKACRKSMFLTGTLTNGESSSIFATLWRAFPGELIEAGFSHNTSKEAWATRYGVIEKTTKTGEDNKNVGSTTNRYKDTTIVKEKPGIAPELVANHLLDKCIFVELQDLQVPLVEIEEKPVIIDLDEEHKYAYDQMHSELYETCKKMQKEVGTGAWAKFNPATLNYADQPSVPVEVIWKKKGDSEILGCVTATTFPTEYLTAKERTLLEIVEDELNQNRPCIIYNNFTGKSGDYRTNSRIQKVLKRHGIDAKILDDTIASNKRFEWLERQETEGTKVIITNMKLVECGLDLMSFPTIIYFQLCDEVSTLRQSSRRAWRLGQPKKCKVLFLVNDGTQQLSQFKRLMSRRVSAMITEGRIERSDSLAQYADAGAGQLTSDLSKQLASSDLTSAWEAMAKKDIDEDLELVSEKDFQQNIKKAFANLTAETIKLCGLEEERMSDTSEADETLEVKQEGVPITEDNINEILDFLDTLDQLSDEPEEKHLTEDTRPETTIEKVTHVVELNAFTPADKKEDIEQLSLFSF
ncbi:helicase-related protein [Bacillus piscicola]|uniref:helicase-related protein n=1 Tax=Bacillus piscicola TaxID=1632684 RepID=UPI001F089A2C|nr:helicase-related protein [Bacillus piscicola]